MRNFAFAVPVAPRLNDVQWKKVDLLLSHTIRSVLNQREPGYLLFIAGHERPACLDDFDDTRVQFVQVDFKLPEDDKSRRRDKNRKRWAIASRYREMGGGYFMFLDADDFIHQDLVAHVLSDDNGVGYLITAGYALDYQTGNIATIPGAWHKKYNEVCGSSGIFFMEPDDLPAGPHPEHQPSGEPYFTIRNHTVFETIPWHGGHLQPIPFPAGVYSLNHTLNLSDILVRTEERQKTLMDGINLGKIDDVSAIADEFGIRAMLESPAERAVVIKGETDSAVSQVIRPASNAEPRSNSEIELQVHMTDEERMCLEGYLKNAKHVLEFGCGGSTRLALESGVEKLWSVESDKGWVARIKKNAAVGAAIEDGRLDLYRPSLGKIGDWGRPIDNAKAASWHTYHSEIWKRFDSKSLDVVFVDGRFRVACALQALLRISNSCVIAVHDFWRRDRYFEILKYVDVVDRVGDLGVFKRKPDADPEQLLTSLFDYVNTRT